MAYDFEELAGRSRMKSDDAAFDRLVRMFRQARAISQQGSVKPTHSPKSATKTRSAPRSPELKKVA